MQCPFCGNDRTSDALYCDDCMNKSQQSPPEPVYVDSVQDLFASIPEEPVLVAQKAYVPGPEIKPARRPLSTPVMAGAAFAATIVVILICFAAYSAAHSKSAPIVVVPDNLQAQMAAKNDRGLLHITRPGDTWTYAFSKQYSDSSDNVETGQIVSKISSVSGHVSWYKDTESLTAVKADGKADDKTIIDYSSQASNRNIYLVGSNDNDDRKMHMYSNPQVIAKGDWNHDASFVIDREISPGFLVHVDDGVVAGPVVVKLSNGTPVHCWNETVTIIADGHYSDTTTNLFCPAIGADISSSEVDSVPGDSRTLTTTKYLTNYSFAK